MKRGQGRPVKGYRTASGERVPGVTTILGRFKESGGLIHWAWKCGIDGINYRDARDKAASAGSIAHQWIDDHVHGQDLTEFPEASREDLDLAASGFDAFLEWFAQTRVQIIETETPLVSEEYRFAGTFDALAEIGGRLVLLDWKTSNATYSDYVCQLAAYRQLLRERGDDVATAQLLRVGKQYADFHLHAYPAGVLDMAWEFFRGARELYDIDKKLRKVAA